MRLRATPIRRRLRRLTDIPPDKAGSGRSALSGCAKSAFCRARGWSNLMQAGAFPFGGEPEIGSAIKLKAPEQRHVRSV
jgi:hypothetical protein